MTAAGLWPQPASVPVGTWFPHMENRSSADALSMALLVWGRAATVLDMQEGAGQGSEGRDPCCITLMVEGGPWSHQGLLRCQRKALGCAGFQEGWPHLLGLSAATLEWTPRTCVATPTPELRGEEAHMKRSLGCSETL